MAYQNNNNRQVPTSVRNVNLQPQAAPVDKLYQYQVDNTDVGKTKALMDNLARLGQGLIDIEPVWQRQADEAIIKATYEDNSNKQDWATVSKNVEGMAQFNPYLKDAYKRMQGQDIVKAAAQKIAAIPSKEQLSPEKYDEMVRNTQTEMFEALKETGLRPKDYGSSILAFDEFNKQDQANYFKKHSEYEYKQYLIKTSSNFADDLFNAVGASKDKLEGYTLALNSFIEHLSEEGVPEGDLAGVIFASIQGYATKYTENTDSAKLVSALRNAKINGKALDEIIPNFEGEVLKAITTAKRASYADRELDYNNQMLIQKINQENGFQEFFNWKIKNPKATAEQEMQQAMNVIQAHNLEGSGGLSFLSNIASTKNYLLSLQNVETDPTVAQEFMAQAAAGELDYAEFSQAVNDGQINYKEVPSFMNRDKAVKEQLEGQFNDEFKAFTKNYLTKGGSYYTQIPSEVRKSAQGASISIQDKLIRKEMTPQEATAALRKLKDEAIPNMILNKQIQDKNNKLIIQGSYRRTVNIPQGNTDKALKAIVDMGIVRNSQGVRANNITIADKPTADRNNDGITNDKHLGFDIGGVYLGQPIYPPQNGTIIASGWEETMGNYAVLQMRNGYMLVQHLLHPVEADRIIGRNVVLGYVGNTGRVSESGKANGCLHVEFWDKDLNLLYPEK